VSVLAALRALLQCVTVDRLDPALADMRAAGGQRRIREALQRIEEPEP
jgi:hypothetical protein